MELYLLVSLVGLRDPETATWAFSSQQTTDMVSPSQSIAMVPQPHRTKPLSLTGTKRYSFSPGQQDRGEDEAGLFCISSAPL